MPRPTRGGKDLSVDRAKAKRKVTQQKNLPPPPKEEIAGLEKLFLKHIKALEEVLERYRALQAQGASGNGSVTAGTWSLLQKEMKQDYKAVKSVRKKIKDDAKKACTVLQPKTTIKVPDVTLPNTGSEAVAFMLAVQGLLGVAKRAVDMIKHAKK